MQHDLQQDAKNECINTIIIQSELSCLWISPKLVQTNPKVGAEPLLLFLRNYFTSNCSHNISVERSKRIVKKIIYWQRGEKIRLSSLPRPVHYLQLVINFTAFQNTSR